MNVSCAHPAHTCMYLTISVPDFAHSSLATLQKTPQSLWITFRASSENGALVGLRKRLRRLRSNPGKTQRGRPDGGYEALRTGEESTACALRPLQDDKSLLYVAGRLKQCVPKTDTSLAEWHAYDISSCKMRRAVPKYCKCS